MTMEGATPFNSNDDQGMNEPPPTREEVEKMLNEVVASRLEAQKARADHEEMMRELIVLKEREKHKGAMETVMKEMRDSFLAELQKERKEAQERQDQAQERRDREVKEAQERQDRLQEELRRERAESQKRNDLLMNRMFEQQDKLVYQQDVLSRVVEHQREELATGSFYQ